MVSALAQEQAQEAGVVAPAEVWVLVGVLAWEAAVLALVVVVLARVLAG